MKNRRLWLILLLSISCLVSACAQANPITGQVPPLADNELDISGTYVGKETYIKPALETGAVPDIQITSWEWKLTRTDVNTYTIHFFHEATPAVGRIALSPQYDVSIDNIIMVDQSIVIPNYIKLHFEATADTLIAYGTYNIIGYNITAGNEQTPAPIEVRIINLTRV